jgi:hypothetical protein
MADPFASPRLTISRAQHHIDDFNAKIIEFVSSQPWSYIIDQDLKGGQDLHKIKFARRLPAELPCIVFDDANNLRSVLDQAGYASAIAGGNPNPKRSSFPFGEDLAGLNNNVDGKRGVCKDIPPEIVALFRSFKPYKGGNDALWALNKLCNTKKHCALVPFDIGRAQLSVTQISQQPTTVVRKGDSFELAFEGHTTGIIGGMSVKNSDWDPDKYEITLARTPLGSHSHYRPNVTLNVALDSIETQRGKPAVAVLREMMRVVDGILSASEAECRRLGFVK